MPLPDHELVLHRGCNCKAVRYRISIPPLAQRPPYPLNDETPKLTFPIILTDRCNDCRSATGSIPPNLDLCSCRNDGMYSHSPTKEPISSSPTTQEIWHPVTKLFYPNPESEPYHLKLFKSSDRSTRSFCGRCGTNLTYSINPKPSDAWPDLFDVVLGTIRRDDLEGEWMIPDRHCWVSKGIPWVGRLTNGIKEMPRHETFKLKEEMPKEAWDI